MLVMSLNLVRVKIIAVLLGPEGVGTLSVLNHFHSLTATFIGLGLGTGIVKYIAKYGGEKKYELQNKIFSSSFQIVFMISILGFLLICIFRSLLSEWILGDKKYSSFVIIFAISFPLAVYPSITNSVLQGMKRIKQLALINFLRSAISILIIIPIVYYFRLNGAVFSVLVITIIHLILNRYFLSKEKLQLVNNHCRVFDTDLLIKIFKYGLTSLVVGTAYYLSHLLLKIIIIDSLGLKMNGIYQPIWALTMTYLTLVLSSMSAYSYPRLCELQSLNEINNELNGIIRVAFLIIIPLMFLLIIARKPLILILYSNNFLPATIYMPVQILGDFFKLIYWALGMYLLPTKRLSAFIVLNLLIDFMLVTLAYFLIDRYQLHGITASFAISHAFGFLALLIYTKIKIKFRFWPINRLMVLLSLVSLILITISERLLVFDLYIIISILVISIWAFGSIRKTEILQFKNYLFLKLSNSFFSNKTL